MPDSMAVQIADALATGLSSYTFSYGPLDAVRRYVPDYEARELVSLKVSVVPGPAETERGARGSDMFTHSAMVVIGRQTDGSNAEIDDLTNLCEEIMDAIRSEILVTTGMPSNARYSAIAMQTSFDRDSLTDRRIFLAQIDVTYRVLRDHIAAPTGA